MKIKDLLVIMGIPALTAAVATYLGVATAQTGHVLMRESGFLQLTNHNGWTFVWTNGVDHPIAIIQSQTDTSPSRLFRIADTNTLSDLALSGKICAAYGHNWRAGRPGEGLGGMYADYHPNTNFRTCQICGICQSQDTTWK